MYWIGAGIYQEKNAVSVGLISALLTYQSPADLEQKERDSLKGPDNLTNDQACRLSWTIERFKCQHSSIQA